MLKKKKNNKGFTLVELLVVIAIIGILAVVAVPALFKNIEKGKVADLEADISAIRSAALSVYADTSNMTNEQIYTASGIVAESKIGKEIEGLSDPFNATNYATTIVDIDPDTSKVKNALLLTINLGNSISKDGEQKLINDLGDKYVNSDGTSKSTASGTSTIYIKLMEM